MTVLASVCPVCKLIRPCLCDVKDAVLPDSTQQWLEMRAKAREKAGAK